jgi:hypothetical protein
LASFTWAPRKDVVRNPRKASLVVRCMLMSQAQSGNSPTNRMGGWLKRCRTQVVVQKGCRCASNVARMAASTRCGGNPPNALPASEGRGLPCA